MTLPVVLMTIASETSWQAAPQEPVLSANEVHVWQVTLDVPASVTQRWMDLLGPAERERAGRFRFARDRNEFVAAHASLRRILGRYLHQQPEQLRFVVGPFGKPALVRTGGRDIQFNMSGSRGLAMYAFGSSTHVGVDVEFIRGDLVDSVVAKRSFSSREYSQFCAFPEAQRVAAFFRFWTRKEAYVKATGKGLSLPLDQFEVSLDTPEVQTWIGGESAISDWRVYEIVPRPGYIAATAVQSDRLEFRFWRMADLPGEM